MQFSIEELRDLAGLLDAGTRAAGLRAHSEHAWRAIQKIDQEIERLTTPSSPDDTAQA